MTSNEQTPREWNATEYHRLANPHVSWGRRVLDRLPLNGNETVIDAGCGSGRLTAELAGQLPNGQVIAIDLSANMLEQAKQHLLPLAGSRVRFRQADLQHLSVDEPVDAIFSTAALHWVLDHQTMFDHFFAALKPGGWLVAQCGGGPNIAGVLERAELLMRSDELGRYFAGWSGPWEFADADETAQRLENSGFVSIATGLEDAPVTLSDEREYRDYLETVVFGSHLARIPDRSLQAMFLDRLTAQAASDTPPFFLDYWRLNIQAQKPEG
ncbi:MAG: methyltransferase domain-containing protein [Thermomicrobiales bacterium]